MSDDKKQNGVISQIFVAVAITLLVGGSSPWWWNVIFVEEGDEIAEDMTLPLQPGEYFYASAYTINIFQRGDRFCIWVISRNGVNTASVFEDSNFHNVYRVHGYPDWSLQQKDYKTIKFGDLEYQIKDGLGLPESSDKVEDCLDSNEPFFIQEPFQF
jgi:hypothetical protein